MALPYATEDQLKQLKTIDTQIKKYGGVFNPEKVKKTNIDK